MNVKRARISVGTLQNVTMSMQGMIVNVLLDTRMILQTDSVVEVGNTFFVSLTMKTNLKLILKYNLVFLSPQ